MPASSLPTRTDPFADAVVALRRTLEDAASYCDQVLIGRAYRSEGRDLSASWAEDQAHAYRAQLPEWIADRLPPVEMPAPSFADTLRRAVYESEAPPCGSPSPSSLT